MEWTSWCAAHGMVEKSCARFFYFMNRGITVLPFMTFGISGPQFSMVPDPVVLVAFGSVFFQRVNTGSGEKQIPSKIDFLYLLTERYVDYI